MLEVIYYVYSAIFTWKSYLSDVTVTQMKCRSHLFYPDKTRKMVIYGQMASDKGQWRRVRLPLILT